MSWFGWVDRMLESGHLDGAAIYGRDPVYQWAATPGLANIAATELQKIGDHLDQKNHDLVTTGFWLGNEKFFMTAAPGGPTSPCVHVKRDKTGIFIYRTRQTYFIGHYPEEYANRLGLAAGTMEGMISQLPEPF